VRANQRALQTIVEQPRLAGGGSAGSKNSQINRGLLELFDPHETTATPQFGPSRMTGSGHGLS
jgi:hypothetical protein